MKTFLSNSCIACWLCALTGLLSGRAYAADPIAYVSTYAQDFITTVDPATGKVTKIANAGTNGTNFVVSPDQSAAYIMACAQNPTTNCSVEAVDLVSGKVTASNLGGESLSSEANLAISSDGALLYFAGQELTAVSTASLTVAAQVPLALVCGPCRVVLAPDGSKIYVSSFYGPEGGVEVLDANSYVEIAQVLPTVGVSGTALSPDGSKLYIATPGSTTMVYVLDTSTYAVTAAIPYTNEGDVSGVAASPDGAMLYLSSGRGLVRIATPANTVIDQIPIAPLSDQIAVSADSQYVFVNREYGGGPAGLLIFNTATATVSTLSIGGPAVAEQAANGGGLTYVLQGSYSISTEDTVTEKAQSIGTSAGTYALTASSSGNAVVGITQYAGQGESIALISVVSTLTHKITNQFTSTFSNLQGSDYAISFALDGDGSLGYAGYTANGGQPTVAVLQLPQGTSQTTFLISTPYLNVSLLYLAVSPDSSTLYSLVSAFNSVNDATTESICGTDLTTLTSTGCAPLALGSRPVNVGGTVFAVTSDGSRAYIQTFQGDDYIGAFSGPFLSEVNLQSMTVTRATSLPFTSVEEGKGMIAYSSATNSVYMANAVPKGGSVVRVDLASFTVAVTQYVGYTPTGMAITPDGTKLLLTGSLGGTQILDGTTLAPTGYILGGLQQSIVLAPQ